MPRLAATDTFRTHRAATLPVSTPATRNDGPLLVVAAWAPELSGLRGVSGAPRSTSKAAAPAAVVRGVVGVGLIEAAAGTARLIATLHPRAIILIGTAGLYPSAKAALSLGGAVIASELYLVSASVASGGAYLPQPLPAHVTTSPRLRRAIAAATGLPSAIVACPLGITRTTTVAARLQRASAAQLENLEAFAVARAAAAARVPFAAVLGIANAVGPAGHAQWRAHGDQAARTACAAVQTFLRASLGVRERAHP